MIPGDGMSAFSVAPPGRTETARVVRRRARRVGVVAGDKYRSRYRVEKARSRGHVGAVALSDVPGPHKDLGRTTGLDGDGERVGGGVETRVAAVQRGARDVASRSSVPMGRGDRTVGTESAAVDRAVAPLEGPTRWTRPVRRTEHASSDGDGLARMRADVRPDVDSRKMSRRRRAPLATPLREARYRDTDDDARPGTFHSVSASGSAADVPRHHRYGPRHRPGGDQTRDFRRRATPPPQRRPAVLEPRRESPGRGKGRPLPRRCPLEPPVRRPGEPRDEGEAARDYPAECIPDSSP